MQMLEYIIGPRQLSAANLYLNHAKNVPCFREAMWFGSLGPVLFVKLRGWIGLDTAPT